MSPPLEEELRRSGLACESTNADIIAPQSLFLCFVTCRSSRTIILDRRTCEA